jgi:hypothetical protein
MHRSNEIGVKPPSMATVVTKRRSRCQTFSNSFNSIKYRDQVRARVPRVCVSVSFEGRALCVWLAAHRGTPSAHLHRSITWHAQG